MTRRREFTTRALLKVYLEASDLQRLTERAKSESRLVAEYVRVLILEHLDDAGEPEAVRRMEPASMARWSAGVFERLPIVGVTTETVSMADSGSDARGVAEDVSAHKGKCCKHGVAKGWRCWQCGGLAVIE